MKIDTELVTPSNLVSNYEANYEASYEANYEASYESSQEASHEANYTANHEANHETNYKANDETNYDTNDEASVTTTTINELANQLTSFSVDVDIELFQNCCLAHIINLIVQNGIKKIKHIINKDIGVLIPPLDCVTRWNSMFLMLDSAIKVKKALLRLKNRDCLFPDPPSEDKWEQASAIRDGLMIFYE
ncbi:707_t:CDS:2, partial [Cetraspora pellucida]